MNAWKKIEIDVYIRNWKILKRMSTSIMLLKKQKIYEMDVDIRS